MIIHPLTERFQRFSVDKKLTIIFMSITMFALLIAGLGFRWQQIRVHKQALANDLYTQAEFLGANAAAALRFDVPTDTQELLGSLSRQPYIVNAIVYNASDQLFASYPMRAHVSNPFLAPASDGVLFTKNYARLIDTITHDGDTLGTIVLVSDLTGMYDNIRESFLVAAALFTICLLVSLFLARSSIRIISRPITALVETSRKVSQTGDYSIRAQKFHPDDFGNLTDRFNEMLGQIESREQMLHDEQLALRMSQAREAELQERLARSERLESLGLLAGGVAHDLNNILGPLVGYPDLILDQLPDDTPVRGDLEQMQQAANKAARVIQDLLTLGRRGNYDRHPVQLNEVVCEYTHSVSYRALTQNNPHISIRVDMDADLPLIDGSTHHLTQVVMNLALNAVEAMPEGGALTISTEHRSLKEDHTGMEIVPAGDYVVMAFADKGVGIEEDDKSHLFEPFYTRKIMGRSGSGLGLSVVYGILKDLGGYVDIESSPNKGSTFSFFFPTSDKTRTKRAESAQVINGEEYILVVDDEPQQRLLASRILTSLGYRVDLASTSEEGIRAAAETAYDVIVLDMILGEGPDGLDTYREIRKRRPDQSCIIASGFSESDRVHAAQEEGAGTFVAKPYTREGLAVAIRTCLDGRQAVSLD